MIKKSITVIILICVILAAALVFANYTDHNNSENSINNPINNSNMKQQDISASNVPAKENTLNTNESQAKISPEEAKRIAQNHIEEPGLTAGTPILTTKKDGDIYIIPIINTKNKTSTGYVAIDAQTGNYMDKGTP